LTLTTTYPAPPGPAGPAGPLANTVYQPQHDSLMLVDAMRRTGIVAGRRVLDLCTGSGFVAIAAAELGCASVTAFDICPHAVRSSRDNADTAGVEVDVRQGSWRKAFGCAPFEVVVSNPPYVPTPPINDRGSTRSAAGPSRSWNGGRDGRLVLGPLCESVSNLLCDGGSLLLVQSAFAGVAQSLDSLQSTGLDAKVIASQIIPFGPVLSAGARWLERTGRVPRGCRKEELVVIQADKP
jgi:release factor glutamine methyltransferase